jgi:hypothetical protein
MKDFWTSFWFGEWGEPGFGQLLLAFLALAALCTLIFGGLGC